MSKHIIYRRIEDFEAIRPMIGEELNTLIALKREIDCFIKNNNLLVKAMVKVAEKIVKYNSKL